MLLSMTGYGEARTCQKGWMIVSEIKGVNNRYFKASIRIPETCTFLETRIEKFARTFVERGTLNICIKIANEKLDTTTRIDRSILKEYLLEAARTCQELNGSSGAEFYTIGSISDYFRLPGVVLDSNGDLTEDRKEELWTAVSENLKEGFLKYNESRLREGSSMETDLRRNCEILKEKIDRIEELCPQVVENWRVRLTERVGKIMEENDLTVSPADLVREIALFTDRADISEEIVRFRSHISQFEKAMTLENACGKKLDFLTQEMFREVNTTGSKGNYSEITNVVVEMKTVIERIREMVQNIE